MVLKLTGYTELMQNEPANKASVDVREKIILPLVTIQQYALQHINFLRKNHPNESNQIVVCRQVLNLPEPACRTLISLYSAPADGSGSASSFHGSAAGQGHAANHCRPKLSSPHRAGRSAPS